MYYFCLFLVQFIGSQLPLEVLEKQNISKPFITALCSFLFKVQVGSLPLLCCSDSFHKFGINE